MKFIKHIGKHADRRVAIVYRVVPDEDHMCLVCYPDSLPTTFHDSIMKVIESDPGQQAAQLSDALFRNLLPDGRPILETLHREGMIKKVPTNQIVVTPNAQSHVRLDELNKILDGIEAGDEATDNMRKLDENSGLVNPKKSRVHENQPQAQTATIDTPAVDMSDMSNEGLANQRVAQSMKLAKEAQAMLVESQRLQGEAWDLNPALKPAVKKVVRKKAVRKKAVKKKAGVKESTNSTSATAE